VLVIVGLATAVVLLPAFWRYDRRGGSEEGEREQEAAPSV
jgi:hypothetical protein